MYDHAESKTESFSAENAKVAQNVSAIDTNNLWRDTDRLFDVDVIPSTPLGQLPNRRSIPDRMGRFSCTILVTNI